MKTEPKCLKEGGTDYGLMGVCAKTQVDCATGDSGSLGEGVGGWDDFSQSDLSQMLILSLSTFTLLH